METWKQGSGRLLAILFYLLITVAATTEEWWEREVPGEDGGGHEKAPFLIKKSEVVVKTEGGEIRVFRGSPWNGHPARMHIGVVTMEPNTLLIPHYLDADLIIFLLRGEARIGWIHKDDLVDRKLKPGDVLRIPAGSAFYVVNTRKDHRLQIIASLELIGTALTADLFTPFYFSGGKYHHSIFAGFDIGTLTSAFLATPEEIEVLTSARTAGPIIFITGKEPNHLDQLNSAVNSAMEKLKHSRRLAQDADEKIEIEEKEDKSKGACTWRSIFSSIFFGEGSAAKNEARRLVGDAVKAPLKHSDISVFLVNLSAGSMMAPHVNPRATEYSVVISGSGTVEVVNPNGTRAMKEKVREGDVFWVPRFYPFCQVAAREEPLQILGFTTSARSNRAQFLAGKSSILREMLGKELAAGFGVTEEELSQVVMRQNESVILPSWSK